MQFNTCNLIVATLYYLWYDMFLLTTDGDLAILILTQTFISEPKLVTNNTLHACFYQNLCYNDYCLPITADKGRVCGKCERRSTSSGLYSIWYSYKPGNKLS